MFSFFLTVTTNTNSLYPVQTVVRRERCGRLASIKWRRSAGGQS